MKSVTSPLKRRARLLHDESGHGYHSAAYHRYFEGYSEYEIPDAKGRGRISRVYTGIYYTPEMGNKNHTWLKCICAFLYLASLALYLLAATRLTGANSTWYVALAQFGALISALLSGSGIINTLTAPRRRTIWEWRISSQRLRRGSAGMAAFLFLSALLNLLYLALSGPDNLSSQLAAIFCFLLAATAGLLLNRLEANVKYVETRSENQIPPEATFAREI